MPTLIVDNGIIRDDSPYNHIEPHEIIAGDSVTWSVVIPGCSPQDWALTYAIKGQSALNVTAFPTGSTNGEFGVFIFASQSAALAEGVYEWAAQVTSGSYATTVRSGRLNVRPSLISATAGSRASHIEKMVTAIETVIEGRIPNDVQQFTIGSRSITSIPIAELMVLRATYRRELYYMRHGKSGIGKNVEVMFRRVGN